MVPWTHLREPPLWGKCLTDLTSEFTHFNLVIRLSKVQQPALPFCTFSAMSCRSGCPLRSFVKCIPYSVKPFRTARNLRFMQHLWENRHHDMTWRTGRFMPFRYGLFLLMVVWWGETYCASNSRELDSRFMPTGARLDHGPGKGITHDI